jgi:hypothetical protein
MAFGIVARGVAASALAGQASSRATLIMIALQEEMLPDDHDARLAVLTFEDLAFDDLAAAGRFLGAWLNTRQGKAVPHAAE